MLKWSEKREGNVKLKLLKFLAMLKNFSIAKKIEKLKILAMIKIFTWY